MDVPGVRTKVSLVQYASISIRYQVFSIEALHSNRTMAFNLELIHALLTEQEQAVITVDRCQRQISRLVTEQLQRHSLKQSTEHISGEHSARQAKKQKQDRTPQAEDLSDEDPIQALQLHEMRSREQSTHSTKKQEPMEEPQIEQHNAIMRGPPQDTSNPQQQPPATRSIATVPELPISGLRAFHICPAMHIDGSGKCLMLMPYPNT